jgi:hypothetical protein
MRSGCAENDVRVSSATRLSALDRPKVQELWQEALCAYRPMTAGPPGENRAAVSARPSHDEKSPLIGMTVN